MHQFFRGSLSGVGLERVPFVQAALRYQEIFKARVSTTVPKELLDPGVLAGEFICGETQREIASQIKIILVRNGEIAVRRFKIVWNFLLEWIQFGDPIDRAGVQRNKGVVLHWCSKADELECRREVDSDLDGYQVSFAFGLTLATHHPRLHNWRAPLG